jgi:hypothetical protein
MATPTKRTPVHIGNQTYNLRYSHLSFVLLEEASGKTIQEHQQAVSRGSSAGITWMLWAGIVHDNRDITFAQVAEQMDLNKYSDYGEAIAEAMQMALEGPVKKTAKASAAAEGNDSSDN